MKKFLILLIFPCLLGAKVEEGNNTPCYKADVLFVIDYSGSMGNTIPLYEPWLRATAGELPLSQNLKAGLLFFSDNVCSTICPLTDDAMLLDEKILEARKCTSCGTYLEEALKKSKAMFDESERERKEKVPRIVVLVTDLDVSDPVESCEVIHSYMSDVFFVLIELEQVSDMKRVKDLKDCLLTNGIYFNGFVWIYEDLLKNFDPCI